MVKKTMFSVASGWKKALLSRVNWLECGTEIGPFFHTSTIVHRRRKFVTALRNVNNKWIVDKSELKSMVNSFFTDLYSEPATEGLPPCLPRGGFPSIPHSDMLSLMTPFSDDEIWTSMKHMGANKALGIDGFQPAFYHKCWSTNLFLYLGMMILHKRVNKNTYGDMLTKTNTTLA
ncbi:hypothetical protein V2J09_001324 [Rumex salicifolius]